MSKPLHPWKIAVTIPLSVLNATSSIPASAWVTQVSKVGSHPYIPMGNHPYISMGNIDYLSIEVLMRHAI